MNGYSLVDYSGGTAFVGLSALRPTELTPFQFAAFADPLGEITLQQVSFTTAVIGTGIVFAHYAGLLDNNAVSKKPLGFTGWANLPAGYFPSKVDAHTDNGESCVLQSPFEAEYCIAEKSAMKWLKYPAGYFPQNVPAYNDNGIFSQLESTFQPEIVFCTLDDAPPPPKWFELYSEFVPSKMDPFVDDEVPFGSIDSPVCPFGSEKVERAFDLLRNPPTPVQLTRTTVQYTLDTPTATGFTQLLIIAVTAILSTAFSVMVFVIQAGPTQVEDFLEDKLVQESVNEEDPAQDVLEEHKEHTNEDQRDIAEVFSVEAEVVDLQGLDEVLRDLAEGDKGLDEGASEQESVLEVIESQVEAPAEQPVEEGFNSGEAISVPDTEIVTAFANSLFVEAEEITIPILQDVLKHIQTVEDRYVSFISPLLSSIINNELLVVR
ncbi:hypothetical protein CPB83DRAFT_898825 [Crepidotus variabilis]|uniref:Uncharacterized protein n=1 Tax=Crepidotus variabilis TaxID=179855 RepID=A0A9P6E6A9_9AGAR|nr:hypothetical protein CPB83DRAFT_898825 [Crepidotus variabilis]